MAQDKSCIGTVARGDTTWLRAAYDFSVRYACMGGKCLIACLSIVGALIVDGGGVSRHSVLLAQSGHLTVRPHEMATGTQTAQAGEQTLDSIDKYLVYVPKQAVGTRRVPLIVSLGGGGVGSRETMDLERELADKYGWILFAPDISGPQITATQMQKLDAGMKQILRKFAIDPDKIVLTGMSNGGYVSLDVGCKNLDIFSRIAPLSPVPYKHTPCGDTTRPQSERTQFFLSVGTGETKDMVYGLLDVGQLLKQDGHLVQLALDNRPHQRRVVDRNHMWHWLQESWAAPNTVAQTTAHAGASSVPLLTTEVLTQMTTLWTRLRQMSDSLSKNDTSSAQKASLKRVRKDITIPIGQEQVSAFDMVDMTAVAAKYPPAATALTKVGLTSQQEEGYRIAFVGARITKVAKSQRHTLTAIPSVETNVAFINAHESDVNALLDLMRVSRCEATVQAQYGC